MPSSCILDLVKPICSPDLEPAVKFYKLLHDILSPEVQTAFCHYFQNNEGCLMDHMTITIAYQKMKTLCTNLRNEIYTDIQIHNQNILPRPAKSLQHRALQHVKKVWLGLTQPYKTGL